MRLAVIDRFTGRALPVEVEWSVIQLKKLAAAYRELPPHELKRMRNGYRSLQRRLLRQDI